MKGAGLFLLCVVGLAHGDIEELNENGCPVDDTIVKLYIHENCDQYYQCLGGKLVARFCESGFHFNPELGKCDWPDTKCHKVIKKLANGKNLPQKLAELDNSNPNDVYSICSAMEFNGALVAHENCDEFFKCSFGKPIAMKCAPDLLYNDILEKCDEPSRVDCGDRIVPDLHIFSQDIQRISNVYARSINSESDNLNKDPHVSCAESDYDGKLVVHELCNQFYKCSHGRPVALKCPVNLLYNDEKQYCDWPQNVNCGDRIIPEKEEVGSENSGNNNNSTDDGGNSSSEEDNYEGSGDFHNNSDPSKAPIICASVNSEGALVAHEMCNMFYKCAGNQAVPMNCPENLVFNSYKNYCDWPINVHCGDRTLEKDDDVSNEANDDENDNTVETGVNHNDPNQAKQICSVHGSEGVLVAHENCNQFYKCHVGVPVALRCPGVLLFNATLKYCDWPYSVDCGNRIVPEPTEDEDNDYGSSESTGSSNNHSDPKEAPTICAAENSDGIMVAHENCNQFYKCFEGKPAALFCQPNLLYNPKKEYCDWQHNVECGKRIIPDVYDGEEVNEESDSPCAGKHDDEIVPHENCSQFYKCLNGKTYPMDCPPGLYYNVEQKVCDWPQNIQCGDRLTEAQAHALTKAHGKARLRFLVKYN